MGNSEIVEYVKTFILHFWCVHLELCTLTNTKPTEEGKQGNLKLSKLLQGLSQLSLKRGEKKKPVHLCKAESSSISQRPGSSETFL